jgi:hypothetical protein
MTLPDLKSRFLKIAKGPDPSRPFAKDRARKSGPSETNAETEKEKAPSAGRSFLFFFYSKFRISVPENKPAKYLRVNWRVSHAQSTVITLDFSTNT